jgi:hypothetical protein
MKKFDLDDFVMICGALILIAAIIVVAWGIIKPDHSANVRPDTFHACAELGECGNAYTN